MTSSPHATFVTAAKAAGFRIAARRHAGAPDFVIEVTTTFTPGDATAYMNAEAAALHVLGLVPMTYAGTVWGSDSGSVGGHAALTSGSFRYCKSGVGLRFGNGVAKLV